MVYANRRSKIYYYPSCRLLRPLDSRITSFSSARDAEDSGYRLCNHCRTEKLKRGEYAKTVDDICDFLKEHYSEKITLSVIASKFNMSPHNVHAMFKSILGVSPRKYTDEIRITKLKEKLAAGDSVISAVYAVGHNSSSWIYTNSRSRLGMTPSRYRHGSAGERILYAASDTDFGWMVVAYTDHGICGVSLVDTEEMVGDYLETEFPKAILEKTEDTNNYIGGIIDYLNGHKVKMPLDFHGTEFQMKVWSTLRKIPHGTTVTYSELAGMVGEPRAVRAVANACARNPVPLIVPCHRVVRKGGNLGGYGLGIERKRKILELERSTNLDG